MIGDIPLNALRSSGFTFSNLTECIDKAFGNSQFPVYYKKDPVNWSSFSLIIFASHAKGFWKSYSYEQQVSE